MTSTGKPPYATHDVCRDCSLDAVDCVRSRIKCCPDCTHTSAQVMTVLLRELLPYARHTHSCGENHGSDCGSYHPPYCRLDWLRERVEMVVGRDSSGREQPNSGL